MPSDDTPQFDTDVLVIGSGFGGSVAALRFAEAGHRVVVLERGSWIDRESFEADLDAVWNPRRHRFGPNELRKCGRNIVPWIGSGVGGGSHVYAGTMEECEDFDRFPPEIAAADMRTYYDRAAQVIEPTPYPNYPPYSECRATQLLYGLGAKLEESDPELIESYGVLNLAIAFAPPDETPGAEFTNKHGARQRYFDPAEQSLLGGEIGAKNTLDLNYLHLAQERGAEIRPMCEADKIEPLDAGGYRVSYKKYVREESAWRRFRRKWLFASPRDGVGVCTARRVVLAAGCVGSTELLLRNRDVHRTLPALSPTLGERYTTNGDFLSLLFPSRALILSWFGLIAAVVGSIGGWYWLAAGGAVGYVAGLVISGRPLDPDIGTTNSDFIKFRAADGTSQGAYIESGRYPTPVRLTLAIILSGLGLWRPHYYGKIIKLTNVLRRIIPPFALFARSWPVPLLEMGRDKAFGKFRLDANDRAVIDFDVEANRAFYEYLNMLGKKVARAGKFWWVPNILFAATKKLEIPHNQGGAAMATSPTEGVVDHAGRVFGYDNLIVMDGSIIPVSPGPNPAFTILALSERGMDIILEQLSTGSEASADV